LKQFPSKYVFLFLYIHGFFIIASREWEVNTLWEGHNGGDLFQIGGSYLYVYEVKG